jgi:hypothetical protein
VNGFLFLFLEQKQEHLKAGQSYLRHEDVVLAYLSHTCGLYLMKLAKSFTNLSFWTSVRFSFPPILSQDVLELDLI